MIRRRSAAGAWVGHLAVAAALIVIAVIAAVAIATGRGGGGGGDYEDCDAEDWANREAECGFVEQRRPGAVKVTPARTSKPPKVTNNPPRINKPPQVNKQQQPARAPARPRT